MPLRVTLPKVKKVALKSLLGHFNDLGLVGSVGASADHKASSLSWNPSLHNSSSFIPQGPTTLVGDVSDIFYFFFCSGRGKGESRRWRAVGDRFFIEKPRRGALRTGGAEGPGGCLQRIGELGEGGLNIFFSEPKCPPSNPVSWVGENGS